MLTNPYRTPARPPWLAQCICETRQALGHTAREVVRTVPPRGYALIPPEPATPASRPPPVSLPREGGIRCADGPLVVSTQLVDTRDGLPRLGGTLITSERDAFSPSSSAPGQLGAAYVLSARGRTVDAESRIVELRNHSPAFTRQAPFIQAIFLCDPRTRSQYLSRLRDAGLPEGN